MTSFSDLALDPKVLQAVSEAGYENPTPIQAQAIPHALEGRDVLGIAQTGTGKTASFVLPMITHLQKGRARARMPRSLVLCPTRELAAQVAENFEIYAKHVKLSMALLIGGVSFSDQLRLLDRGVDVLIATPGRLLDHFERGKLMLTGVQIMVVDEADRMLDMGFIPDIERIFKLTPFTRQTLFFSATMAPEITRITGEFLSNPVRVEVSRQATTVDTIHQFACVHRPSRKDRSAKEKRELLRRLMAGQGEKLTNAIIFCNRKRDVDIVAKSLKRHGFDASPLHGDLDQSMRMRILGQFRDGELKFLVASDVAARGLDIPNVSHIFNFDVPIHSEDYVHRVGRTGRAGREGISITLCLSSEEKYLEKIEDLTGKKIARLASPLADTAEPPVDAKTEHKPRPDRKRRTPRTAPKEDSVAEEKSRDTNVAEVPPARPARRDGPRDGQREGQRDGGGRRRDSGRSVVGLGNHVPAFLMREMRVEIIEDAADAPEPGAAEAAAEEPAKKPARKRRAPAKKTKPPETEPPETEPPETDDSQG